MTRVVLDTSAVLAMLFNEPGAEVAIARGRAGAISTVSYCEALAKSVDRGVPLEVAERSINGLWLALIPFDTEHAMTAASFRPPTRHLNVSFADRACLATASLAGVPVLTADRAWVECGLGLDIILIR